MTGASLHAVQRKNKDSSILGGGDTVMKQTACFKKLFYWMLLLLIFNNGLMIAATIGIIDLTRMTAGFNAFTIAGLIRELYHKANGKDLNE